MAKKTTTKKATTTDTNDMVVLKTVCREFDMDPRKARQKLRKTIGNTDGRWAWAEGSKEIAKVREVLSGEKDSTPAEKPATPAKKKAVKDKKKDKKKPAKKKLK